jgi:hypothetical protein
MRIDKFTVIVTPSLAPSHKNIPDYKGRCVLTITLELGPHKGIQSHRGKGYP